MRQRQDYGCEHHVLRLVRSCLHDSHTRATAYRAVDDVGTSNQGTCAFLHMHRSPLHCHHRGMLQIHRVCVVWNCSKYIFRQRLCKDDGHRGRTTQR